jgi:fibronectin-binding autotransporter adhesin
MTTRNIFFGTASQGKISYDNTTGNFTLGNSNAELLHINSNKNVGIGFATNETVNYRLDISGGAVNTDTNYNINGTNVLDSTTLGSNIVNSSLTNLGTLTSLNVNGNTQTTSLGVDGNSTLTGTLDVTDNTTLSTVTTTGQATLESALVTNNTSLSTVSTSGLATLDSASIANNITVGGNLSVTGNSSLSTVSTTGQAILNSAIITNNTTTNSLNVTGDVISDTFTVDSTNNRIGINKSVPTKTLDIVGDAEVSGSLVVQGDITVNGSMTTIQTENMTIEDQLIQLAKGNTADTVDIGFFGSYNDGTDKYTGMYRDSVDGIYKFFTGLEEQPTTNINTVGTGYTEATILVGDIKTTTLNATGNVQVNSLDIVNNTTVGGTFDVTNNTSLSTVSTSGLATLDSASITNNTIVGGTFDVTGNTSLSTISTSGLATLESASITNNTSLSTVSTTGLATLNSAAVSTTLDVTGNTSLSTISTSGQMTIGDHIIPDTDIAYDLGSETHRFRDLFLSGNTIHIGDASISSNINDINFSKDLVIGNLRLMKDTNKIGIGITNPTSALDVNGDISLTGSIIQNGITIENVWKSNGDEIYNDNISNVIIGGTTGTSKLHVIGDINATSDYKINGTTILNETTIESSVVNSSLQNLGTQNADLNMGTQNITNVTAISSTNVTATNLTGTLQTDAQPNITSVGTLSSLNVNGNTNLTTLNSYQINNNPVLSETTLGSSVLNSSLQNLGTQNADLNMGTQNITNATSISATNLTGTLQTVAQPNVTSVGTLSSLSVSGDISIDNDTLKVDSTNNNVGIGIAAPDSKLHIIEDTDNQADETGFHSLKIGTGTNGQSLMAGYDGDDDISYINSGNTDGITNLVLQSRGGHVGIGITNPTHELEIVGDINFTGTLYKNGVEFSDGVWGTNGDKIYNNSGNVGVGTTNPSYKLDVNGAAQIQNDLIVQGNIFIQGTQESNNTYTASIGKFEHYTIGSTSGGTPASTNTWLVRPLNRYEDQINSSSFMSLDNNQITLEPGRYDIDINSIFNSTSLTVTRFRNITEATSVNGNVIQVANGNMTSSNIKGVIEITNTSICELQYMVSTATTDGLGLGFTSSGIDNIFATVIIKKIS